jgi:hypothetical protein
MGASQMDRAFRLQEIKRRVRYQRMPGIGR